MHSLMMHVVAPPSRRLSAHLQIHGRSAAHLRTCSFAGSDARSLGRVIRQQAARRLNDLRRELVEPWFAPTPAPLHDTVDPEQLADADSRFINVDGVKLHYKDTGGDSPEPAMLLLHGFNGSTFSWRDVMDGLSNSGSASAPARRRVIAFDRPPFGLSERPLQWEGGAEGDPYSCKGGARLAAGLLDALGIESAVVIGHSMGAVAALELLKQRPELVAGLGLVAPALPKDPNGFRRAMTFGQQLQSAARLALMHSDAAGLTWVRSSLRARAAEVAAGQLNMYHNERQAGSDVIEGYLRPMKAHNWDRGSLLGFRSFSFPADLPAYSGIKQPVLVVQGRQDSAMLNSVAAHVVSELSKRTDCITDFVEFDACGHIPMEEYPERFVAAVHLFMHNVTQQRQRSAAGKPADSRIPVMDTSPLAAAGLADVETVE